MYNAYQEWDWKAQKESVNDRRMRGYESQDIRVYRDERNARLEVSNLKGATYIP